MVKTRGMQEPVTAASDGDEPVSTELATAVGPADPPNYSVTESDQTQPHSPGATTPPHRQPRRETKAHSKALARARLELAAARLALLEAESADEELLEGSSTATSKRQTDAADTLSEHRGHIRPPQSQPVSPHRESPTQPRHDDSRTTTPNDAPPPPSPQRSDEGSLLQGLTQALLEVARGKPAASRYEFDLPIFSGHPGEWLHFKAAYNESASTHTEAGNLARLRKSLRGPAFEAVKCLFLGSSAVQIMQRLESRFGRPHALITYELNKLRQLPKVSDNPTDICVFASKVTNAIAAVQALKRTEYLYSPEMLSAISEKLSVTLRSRWYDYEMAAGDAEPGLVVLGRFLDREADLNARHASVEVEHKRNFPQRPAHKTFKIETEKIPCMICNGNCSSVAICSNFKKMSINDRWETARKNKLCFRCLNRRTWKHRCKSKQCEVQDCEHYHHRLLHSDSRQGTRAANDPEERPRVTATEHVASRTDTAPCGVSAPHAVINNTSTPRTYNQVLLKVVPVTLTGPNGKVDTFALLDDGSTITLLDTDVAQRIGVKGPNEPFYIEAVAGARIDATNSQRVKVNIRGRYTTEGIDIEARTIDRLELSGQSIRAKDLAGFEHLTPIAEQLAYDAGVPTVLIGQDNWALLLASEARVGTKDQPVASRTLLGWILHGKTCGLTKVHVLPQIGERCSHVSTDESIEKLIQEHFSLESLGVQPRRPQADPEMRALKILKETTRSLPEGGYETGLLWKNEGRSFPDNYASALSRLQSTESRLRKDQTLKQKYSEQMKALISNGYAELAPLAPSSGHKWYLPHFPVINPSKPGKVRIVYDAAARTHGVCLNDYLLTGPDLLQSLLGVLMRFRQKPVAVSADIKDMFLRITVRVEDRDALRFLWRDDTTLTPIEYRMKAVLFGATSSPSTAIYVKNLNAQVHEADYPEAVNSIVRNHYMDDFLQSFENAEEANRVSKAVDAVHRRGNFVLQKWASNEPAAVAGLSSEPAEKDTLLNKEEKILGLIWRHENDTLGFNFRKVDPSYLSKQVTKRQLLKTTMSLYDPLGLAAPFTTQAKCILQDAWRSKIGWDERLPKSLERKWRDWINALQILKGVHIPRCHPGYNDSTILELHVFVDASERAYAAAAYWRSVNGIGQVNVSLAVAKGRVAPLKVTSIPRLELQAAVLGGRLARCAEEEHDRRADRRVFWSDSRTVLAWLRAGARAFKPFVAHRVAELEETTERNEWRWVPTAHNVADDSTRDTPTDFTSSHRWYTGPSFLYDNENDWPQETDSHPYIDTGEERVTVTAAHERSTLIEALPDVTRFSSWLRLIRTAARVLQFIDRLRVHTTTAARKRNKGVSVDDPNWTVKQREGTRKRSGVQSRNLSVTPTVYIPLGTQYTRRAEILWTRAIQEESFANELRHVTGGRTIPADSRLKRLSLRVDEQKIMRIRSRIAAAVDISRETQSPAVLDGDHGYCRLYIDWIHRKLHHSGVECVVNEVRQHYWILRLRPSVRAVIKLCQPCRLRRAVPPEPLTGDLPPCRLAHHQRPFTHTGLDYFGPLSVTVARHHEKRYVALFTCLTTRAVHLEVAASLSTDAAILALRRMMARRGCPEVIWSDNGTNFHGADAELRKATLESLQHEAEVRHIDWRYIPPGAPFMGGAWERLVRTVKAALNATLIDRHPYEDVLHTLLTEVEHTVNSRPLTHVSVNPDDEEALTPNHFLLGAPSKVPLPGIFTRPDELRHSHWRASQRLADLFWQRWVREVLPTLQNRREPHGRGDTIKVGDLVVIVDSNLPRNIWPKGRVERTYPGADGVVRVVDVKTKSGVMRRPVKRLVVIPVET